MVLVYGMREEHAMILAGDGGKEVVCMYICKQ